METLQNTFPETHSENGFADNNNIYFR